MSSGIGRVAARCSNYPGSHGDTMTFKSVSGGFDLSAKDRETINKQRAITKLINDRFVQVGAIFLKTSSKNPYDPDGWTKTQHRDTDLQGWIDSDEFRYHNVGFNLQQGWMDVDIDADDPEFNRCVLAALRYLNIDNRFKFGRASAGCATHVLLQLGEEESQNFEYLQRFEPKEFRIGGKRYHVQLRSYPTNTSAANLVKKAKQTVMPGSIYSHKSKPNTYDISVWYSDSGVANDITNIAATTPRRVNFNEVVRAITFATFLYVLKDEWVEGSRQTTAQKVSGWLARVVADSAAMNNQEAIANDVFCPVDTDDIAESLLYFICDELGDDEKHMRVRAYHDARDKMARNPDAKIPGWPAMENLIGGEKTNALRTVFMPGSDVSNLTKMAERYIYDETDNRYIDRQRFLTLGNYIHAGDELERRHKGDVIRISGKPREAFKVFESSDMRKRVGFRDLHPNLNPGGIYRMSSVGEVLSDEDDDDSSAIPVFNTWRGWPIAPCDTPDRHLMNGLVGHLDRLLSYMTRDNQKQVDWIKKWIAWTFQFPGEKQQIALVIVGGQGVGKSWLGNVFIKALMGSLWGSASPKVLSGDFSIEPFVNKMFVFIDEAKFHNEMGTDEIKKLIRSVDVPGAEKFQSARNYRLFSRIMFASNRMDMNIGQTNIRDRALFYTRAYDKDHLGMDEMHFREWTGTLKPFFDEFTALMQQRTVREHYMHYFMNMELDRYEIESIKHSSSSDPSIVLSNMSWARRVAKHIIEDGRIFEDLDISFPFTVSDLFKRVGEVCKELGMRDVQGARVLAEFDDAGVLEKVVVQGQKKLRFTHKIGSLTDIFGAAISTPLDTRFEFKETDYGENDCDGSTRPPWKGARPGVVASTRF